MRVLMKQRSLLKLRRRDYMYDKCDICGFYAPGDIVNGIFMCEHCIDDMEAMEED
jgi:hypothetical protein